MSTYHQGQVQVGSAVVKSQAGQGVLLAVQSAPISFDADLVQDVTFNVPVGSHIVDIVVDVGTAYDSLTSATLSVGTSSGDTTYVSGVNAKTAGRARPAFTGAQVAALRNIASSTVVATVTSVGQPAAGSARVTIVYEPKDNES
jgi:hypothetical protein